MTLRKSLLRTTLAALDIPMNCRPCREFFIELVVHMATYSQTETENIHALEHTFLYLESIQEVKPRFLVMALVTGNPDDRNLYTHASATLLTRHFQEPTEGETIHGILEWHPDVSLYMPIPIDIDKFKLLAEEESADA